LRRSGTAAVELDGVEIVALAGLDCDDGDPTLGVEWPAGHLHDGDFDGFGDAPITACLAPGSGVVTVSGDCDDTDVRARPGAGAQTIARENGSFDWNCDGQVTPATTSTPASCVVNATANGCDVETTMFVTTPCSEVGTRNSCVFDATTVSCSLSSAPFIQSCR